MRVRDYKCPTNSSPEHGRTAVPDHTPDLQIECSWAGVYHLCCKSRAVIDRPYSVCYRSRFITMRGIQMVKVLVVGYGVIGQRLADGVALQNDMELVGVVDAAPTLSVRALRDRGMPYK